MILLMAVLTCIAISAGFALFMQMLIESSYSVEGKCIITSVITTAVFFSIVVILWEATK